MKSLRKTVGSVGGDDLYWTYMEELETPPSPRCCTRRLLGVPGSSLSSSSFSFNLCKPCRFFQVAIDFTPKLRSSFLDLNFSYSEMQNMKLCPVEVLKGSVWDEASNSEVVQILITYHRDTIYSLQFAYAETTGVRHSQIYGQPNGRNFKSVLFDYPSEFLTSVSGNYADDYGSFSRLISVTFGTNRGTYGPYGSDGVYVDDEDILTNIMDDTYEEPHVTEFNYEFGPMGFGGFHGSVFKSFICSIGVYVKPVHALNTN